MSAFGDIALTRRCSGKAESVAGILVCSTMASLVGTVSHGPVHWPPEDLGTESDCRFTIEVGN